jgi:hypothetical protein
MDGFIAAMLQAGGLTTGENVLGSPVQEPDEKGPTDSCGTMIR